MADPGEKAPRSNRPWQKPAAWLLSVFTAGIAGYIAKAIEDGALFRGCAWAWRWTWATSPYPNFVAVLASALVLACLVVATRAAWRAAAMRGSEKFDRAVFHDGAWTFWWSSEGFFAKPLCPLDRSHLIHLDEVRGKNLFAQLANPGLVYWRCPHCGRHYFATKDWRARIEGLAVTHEEDPTLRRAKRRAFPTDLAELSKRVSAAEVRGADHIGKDDHALDLVDVEDTNPKAWNLRV